MTTTTDGMVGGGAGGVPPRSSAAPPSAPSRTTRAVSTRLSLEGDAASSMAQSASASAASFSMERSPAAPGGSSFSGLLRFSPRTSHGTTGLSPYNRSRHNRARFFDNNNNNNNSSRMTTKETSTTTTNMNNHQSLNVGPNAAGTTESREDHDVTPLATNNNLNNTTTNNNNNARGVVNNNSNDNKVVVVDGLNLTQLQQLATHALLDAPTEAVFYASLLYTKSRQQQQQKQQQQESNENANVNNNNNSSTAALLLAKAYCQTGQPSNALRLLQETNLLQSRDYWIQGVLIAAQALAATQDWTVLVEILEDACRLSSSATSTTMENASSGFHPHFSNNNGNGGGLSRPLEDDDDFGWETLQESITNMMMSQQQSSLQQDTSKQQDSSLLEQQHKVHPLARLCAWRGRAYYETGHVLRAALYWKRALHMDCRAVQAFYDLLEHALVTPLEAYELVQSLDFGDHSNNNNNNPQQQQQGGGAESTMSDYGFLRALYLTRIELSTSSSSSAATSSSSSSSDERTQQSHHQPQQAYNDDENQQNGKHASANDNSLLSHHHNNNKSGSFSSFRANDLDASSISLSSPIVPNNHAFTPAGGGGTATTTTIPTNGHHHRSNNNNNPQQQQQQQSREEETRHKVQRTVDNAFDQLQNVYKLHESPQFLVMSAKRAYRRYQWNQVLHHCTQLARTDPTLGAAAYVYIATLLVRGHKRTLFQIAHQWVEARPHSCSAWFAVGAYYSATGRHHVAQRHYCRATRLDPTCTEAWIAFGVAFANCDESDQALASFRAAQRLSPGEHASLLYMGMEYNRTNHLVLAQNFLQAALTNSGGSTLLLTTTTTTLESGQENNMSIARHGSGGGDPLCWHELGVLAANKGEVSQAMECFLQVLRIVVVVVTAENNNTDDYYHDDDHHHHDDDDTTTTTRQLVELCTDPYWEPTIFNLGHAHRKLRQYEAAATCYARCISLCPTKCSGYSALALSHQLQGQTDLAVHYYHAALSCKPDDAFSAELLQRALSSHLKQQQQAATTGGSAGNNEGASTATTPSADFVFAPPASMSSSAGGGGGGTSHYQFHQPRTDLA